MKPLSHKEIATFQETILFFYKNNKRDFPWRKTKDPYKILVSEIMLQQTQTERVIVKYKNWVQKFPNFETLAKATLKEVLVQWQGLGYNRRALALKRTAETIVEKYHNRFPKTYEEILHLPGIGPYTAGAIMAFAFNKPVPVIETNIRTVYIYFFFKNSSTKISDKEILPLIEQTLGTKNSRDWYHALMDYGAMLKKTVGNLNRTNSLHYIKQSSFKGSDRELRAAIVRTITLSPQKKSTLLKILKKKYPHITNVKLLSLLKNLEREGFLKVDLGTITLA